MNVTKQFLNYKYNTQVNDSELHLYLYMLIS